MRQLAEQLKNNPQQLARPLDPNTRVMRQDDLRNMIDRLERLSRSGDKDAAKQLLDQLSADAREPADGAARPGRRRHGAGAERARRRDPQAAAIARPHLQGRPGFAPRQRGQRGEPARPARRPEPDGRPAAGSAGAARPPAAAAGSARQAGHAPARPAGATRPGRQQQGQQGQGRATTAIRSAMPTARWATPAISWATAMRTARSARRAGRWRRCGKRRAGPRPADAAGPGRRQSERQRAVQPRRPAAEQRPERRSARTSVARPRVQRRLTREDSGRDRRAARAPHPRGAAPPLLRSAAAAARARLSRAVVEGLLISGFEIVRCMTQFIVRWACGCLRDSRCASRPRLPPTIVRRPRRPRHRSWLSAGRIRRRRSFPATGRSSARCCAIAARRSWRRRCIRASSSSTGSTAAAGSCRRRRRISRNSFP